MMLAGGSRYPSLLRSDVIGTTTPIQGNGATPVLSEAEGHNLHSTHIVLQR